MASDLIDAVAGLFSGDAEVGKKKKYRVRAPDGTWRMFNSAAEAAAYSRGVAKQRAQQRAQQPQRPGQPQDPGYGYQQQPGYGYQQQPGYGYDQGYPQDPGYGYDPGYPQDPGYGYDPGYPQEGGYYGAAEAGIDAAQMAWLAQRGGLASAQPAARITPQGYMFQSNVSPYAYGYAQGYGYPGLAQAQPIYPRGYGYGYGRGYAQPPAAAYAPGGEWFPGEGTEFGVAAAVGEEDIGADGDVTGAVGEAADGVAVGGAPNVTIYLVDPWPAPIADQAYQIIVAAARGDKKAVRILDEVKKLADKGDAGAISAWAKFGAVAKLKTAGLGTPSEAALGCCPARGLAVAGAVSPAQLQRERQQRLKLQRQLAAQRQGQIVRIQKEKLVNEAKRRFAAEKEQHAAQVRDLESQLQRRDWSDETRAALEAQKVALEARFQATLAAEQAAMAAAQAAPTAAAAAQAMPAAAALAAAEVEASAAPEITAAMVDETGTLAEAVADEATQPGEFNAEQADR